jgi:hypothetical protein
MPRCLWVFTRVMPWLFRSRGGWSCGALLEMSSSFVFGGLNETRHLSAQCWICSRFSFIISAASAGLSTSTNRHVSSAKSLILQLLITCTMSFMNIRKRSGPRTDPCGTPAQIFPHVDFAPLIMTLCCLSVR